jgi:hypothetical protein
MVMAGRLWAAGALALREQISRARGTARGSPTSGRSPAGMPVRLGALAGERAPRPGVALTGELISPADGRYSAGVAWPGREVWGWLVTKLVTIRSGPW